MDFFHQQDIARRNTRLLVLLFTLAVTLLIGLTNLLIAAFLWFSTDYNIYSGSRDGLPGLWAYFSWARFGTIGLAVTATVALVVLVKWIQLSSGGKVVAESMGGSRVLPQTDDPDERRCLNIIDEMALAASMPVPPLYVLDGERGINAFAAGISPTDVVVAVTRGSLQHLTRDELQGVIAHEFSHILNGDMRLNIRLAAMLKGITFVGDVGHILLRSTHYAKLGDNNRRDGVSALLMLGLGLWLLGGLGSLAAGCIKAAIGRQKEYLADAGAVQYTRNPEGIGDALKVIGGYVPGTLVHAARAPEMAHIFFGQVKHGLWYTFASHPPLEDRIRRLDPYWSGLYVQRKVNHYRPQHEAGHATGRDMGQAAIAAAALLAVQGDASAANTPAPVEQPILPVALPRAFVTYAHEPLGANALVFALALGGETEVRQRQLASITEMGVAGLADLVHTLGPGVGELASGQRLPLLELCLPALKAMSPRQYRQFKTCLLQLIRADTRTDLFEWCLFQLVRHYLDPEFVQVKASKPRYRSLKKVRYHLRVVLSVLAWEGDDDTQASFRLAADQLDFPALQLLPREQATVAAFSRGVQELADCYPLLKPRILKAMALAAGADGEVSSVEREIIASIAAVMDCPMPPIPARH